MEFKTVQIIQVIPLLTYALYILQERAIYQLLTTFHGHRRIDRKMSTKYRRKSTRQLFR